MEIIAFIVIYVPCVVFCYFVGKEEIQTSRELRRCYELVAKYCERELRKED